MKTKLNFNTIACITMIMSGVLSMKSLVQDFSVKKDIISKDKIPSAALFINVSGKDEEVKVAIPNKGEKELLEFLIKNKYL